MGRKKRMVSTCPNQRHADRLYICPRQPFSSIFTKKTNNNNNKKRPSSFSGAVRVKNYVVHLSTSTPVIIARTHTIKLLHICGLISDKMCHFSDKMLSFCDKIMTKP